MSQNLVEKLQEIWDNAQKDPTFRHGKRQWKKIQKTDGYKIAASLASDVGQTICKGARYLWNRGKIYGLVAMNLLTSGPLVGNPSPSSPRSDKDEDAPAVRKEYRLSDIQAHLQAMHSSEELESICTKLISTDSIYTQICAERSQQVGDEILRVAKEIQTQIGGDKGKRRAQILRKRWGNDVPIGLHCLRSALEVTAEAAENTLAPEFIDMFVQKIRDYNPNGYYGLHDVFYKHRNYKKTTRQHNLLQIIKEETAENPNDICLIAHKSKGNHTGSGYHMVLYYNGMIVSFNGEHIEPAADYFKYRSTQGDLINISRTVREDGKDEIVRQIVNQIKNDIKKGKNETIQTLLAMYMGNKDIPLQDRMLAGSVIQNNMPLVASINPLDNLSHLRQVRAKLKDREQSVAALPSASLEKNNLSTNKNNSQIKIAQSRKNRQNGLNS